MKNSKILCKNWWIKAFARGSRTFFQTMIAMLPVESAIEQVDYKVIVLVALSNMGLSLINSVISLPEYKLEEDIKNEKI